MPKKKTNYERKGFAKRLSSRIFSRHDKSSKPEDRWRPRKTKFEALQPDDDDDLSAPTIINNFSFSVESETGGYKRDIDTKKKKALRKLNKKTDFAGISIQPSSRDKHTSSTRKKKQRADNQGFPLSSNASMDYSFDSRQSASTRQTTMSDPTNLFSSKPVELTRSNLNHFSNEIENENPRSKFYQFTIDEDKESTVILPVGFADDDETTQRTYDDDVSSSRYSGSRRNSSHERAFAPFKEDQSKAFDKGFASTAIKENALARVPSVPSLRASDQNISTVSQPRNPSVASLCYSPSPKHEGYGFTSPSKRMNEAKSFKNQQRFIRDKRTPLSALNRPRESNLGTTSGIQKRNDGFSALASWSDFVQDTSSNSHGGFKAADNISDIFEENKDSHVFDTRAAEQSKRTKGFYGFATESKPVNSFDSADSADTFRPRLEDEVPMGIQSFEGASSGSSAPSSVVSATSQGRFMYNRRVTASSFDDDDSQYSVKMSSHHSRPSVGRSSHGGSNSKPMGLPSNAIMASMLFQRHHKIDTRVVEAKLKARREESSKQDANRGDVPRAIQAQEDTYSCISSFSEDTSVGPWRKPTRDLLDHFTNSHSTEHDAGRFRREQLAKAPTLFEA